jgi:hypothetical protein
MYDNVYQAMQALIGAGGREVFLEKHLHMVALRMLWNEETPAQASDFYASYQT